MDHSQEWWFSTSKQFSQNPISHLNKAALSLDLSVLRKLA
jgi:hypothetical protein